MFIKINKLFKETQKNQKGFTLIELLIVVVILGIITAIAVGKYSSSTTDAKTNTDAANKKILQSAVERYKFEHGGSSPGANLAELVSAGYISEIPKKDGGTGTAFVLGDL